PAGPHPERDPARLAACEMPGILPRDGAGDFALPGLRQGDGGLAAAHPLPRPRHPPGDDPRLVSFEHGVFDRIAGDPQLRFGRIERRDGRIQIVAPGVVTLLGNDRLREESLAAFEIVARPVTEAADRGDRATDDDVHARRYRL